jgi:hypothetical protein
MKDIIRRAKRQIDSNKYSSLSTNYAVQNSGQNSG